MYGNSLLYMLQRHKTQSLKQNVKSILKEYSTEFHQTCVKHSSTRIDENRMVKSYQSTMPNGQLWYFMSYAIMDRATLLDKHSYLLCLEETFAKPTAGKQWSFNPVFFLDKSLMLLDEKGWHCWDTILPDQLLLFQGFNSQRN